MYRRLFSVANKKYMDGTTSIAGLFGIALQPNERVTSGARFIANNPPAPIESRSSWISDHKIDAANFSGAME